MVLEVKKMVLTNANKQKSQTRARVRALRSQTPAEGSAKTNVKREQFLKLLKNRYGYVNDQAVDELERLLTQFSRTNKSLDSHHAHPIFRHSRTD